MPTPLSIFSAAASANANMTCRQMALLCALAEEGGDTTSAYARKLGYQTPVITRGIDMLVEAGLAHRRTSFEDRRKTILTVTHKGAALVQRLSHAAEG